MQSFDDVLGYHSVTFAELVAERFRFDCDEDEHKVRGEGSIADLDYHAGMRSNCDVLHTSDDHSAGWLRQLWR